MSAEEGRTQLVWQLVQHALRRSNLPDISRQTQQLHSYAVRLLSSNLNPSTLHDEQSLLQTLKTDLERRGSNQDAARLLECHSRLCARGGLDQRTRTGLLAVLARVSKDDSRNQDLGLSSTSSLGLMVIHPSLQQPSQSLTGAGGSSGAQDSRRSSGAGNPAPYTVSFPPSLESSFSHADSQGRGKGEKASARGPASSILGHSGIVEQTSHLTINEPVMVRDVLYACQGVSGRFTTYNEDAGLQGGGADTHAPCDQDGCGGYVVAPEAHASQVERMLMARLTELGWLFRRVQSHVSGSSSARGAMRQALQGALQAELADYYRLMAVLDQHAAQPIPVQGEGESGGTYLTLRRLVVWLSEPQRRMRVLALLADATAGKEGGALAGAVHALAQHGDPFVASFTNKVLQAVCVPLFDMIRRWVFEGVLEDPRNEFFVRAAHGVTNKPAKPKGELAEKASALQGAPPPLDLWRAGYWLERRQLPVFISDALASKVLRAGKSINFLQGVCNDVRWAQEAGTVAVAAAVAADTRPGLLEGLERAVDTAATMVDARVMEVLHQRYHLAKHCDAVRRYLLLGQGDFIQAFMELVSKELDQAASNVSEMQLSHALRTAINSTCAKYDEEDVLERLRAKKDRSATGGESGWDVLTLTYEVPTPLATIFTPTAMAQYLRVFQLLWRLKRAEASLAACWTTLQCQVHRTLSGMRNAEGVGAAEGLARRCLRLRADMSHFATNLQYYLMFEVMEAAWQEFNRRAGAARDLDALIAAHNDYLATLLRKALLDEGSQALRVTLGEMTTHMLSLHGLVHNLSEVVQGAERRLQDKRRSVQARTAAGQWGVVAGPDTIPDGVPLADLAPLAQRVAELEKLHSRALQTFTRQLPAQAHDEVRFLLYRLDFNEFNSYRQS